MKIIALLIMLLVSFAANADEKSVENYLNNIQNFSADFVQVDASGAQSKGKFYMQKPGKIRWEYQDQPLLIVSSGKILTYYDKQLNEITQIPASQTLAGFLAREKIKFSGDIKLLEYEQKDGFVKAHITQAEKPEDGSLVLYFDKTPMKITMLEVIDANNDVTKVFFNNQNFVTKIDKEKFVFKNPNFHKNAWE